MTVLKGTWVGEWPLLWQICLITMTLICIGAVFRLALGCQQGVGEDCGGSKQLHSLPLSFSAPVSMFLFSSWCLVQSPAFISQKHKATTLDNNVLAHSVDL